MCIVKTEAWDQSVFAFLGYDVTAKKGFLFGPKQSGKCSVTRSVPLIQFRTSSAETCVQVFNESLEAWSLDMVMFFSALSNWVIILPTCAEYHIVWKQEKCFFLSPTNTNCLVRFDSNVNGLFGQVLSILSLFLSGCVCVCVYTGDSNHEPCWQPAASAARNKTRNKCFMKQTYTRLPDFLVTSLPPAAASMHLIFLVCFHFSKILLTLFFFWLPLSKLDDHIRPAL